MICHSQSVTAPTLPRPIVAVPNPVVVDYLRLFQPAMKRMPALMMAGPVGHYARRTHLHFDEAWKVTTGGSPTVGSAEWFGFPAPVSRLSGALGTGRATGLTVDERVYADVHRFYVLRGLALPTRQFMDAVALNMTVAEVEGHLMIGWPSYESVQMLLALRMGGV